MIHNENDIINFESCIAGAFGLLRRAVDMVEDGDHRKIVAIKQRQALERIGKERTEQ